MVQLPEICAEGSEAAKAGYKTISDLSMERIRRSAAAIRAEVEATLNLDQKALPDLGFKAFKLAASNFTVWNGDPNGFCDSGQQLDLHVDHVSPAASPEDVLFELLVKAGFPLTTPYSSITLAGKQVYSIQDGALLICLDRNLTSDLIDALADALPLQVICLDEGFRGNDQLKANAVQTFKARAQAEESEIVFRTV